MVMTIEEIDVGFCLLSGNTYKGYPDPNYVWEGDVLVWEREVIDEEGKPQNVKTYKKPIEITANFTDKSKIFGVTDDGKIEKAVVKKFGGALKGFVWLDDVEGGGEVILPFTAPHIFIAKGDRLDPVLTEISTDPEEENHYEVIDGKTIVHVSSFSGIGGAAGAPPTLIAHYKMNEDTTDKIVADSSGNGHTGASIRNTEDIHVAGKINGAFDFNGSFDYIGIADADTLDVVAISISAWVNLDAGWVAAAVAGYVIAKMEDWVAGGEASYGLACDGSGRPYLAISDNGNNTILELATDAISVSVWHHIVGTYDGAGTYKIYVDGVLVASNGNGSATGTIYMGTGRLTLGARYDSSDVVYKLFFNGLIDNVALFGVVLSPDEVKRIYNNGHGTEILAEIDPVIRPRRGTSPLGLRSRYEF